jgi:hypothetical protein
MNPIRHPSNNVALGPPAGWDEEKNGPCATLHCTRTDTHVVSLWKPDEKELQALRHGGTVALWVIGETHPPLWVSAEPAERPAPIEGAEALGLEIDQLSNLAGALKLGLPAATHVDVLRRALPVLVKALRTSFVKVTGENPWGTHPDAS